MMVLVVVVVLVMMVKMIMMMMNDLSSNNNNSDKKCLNIVGFSFIIFIRILPNVFAFVIATNLLTHARLETNKEKHIMYTFDDITENKKHLNNT